MSTATRRNKLTKQPPTLNTVYLKRIAVFLSFTCKFRNSAFKWAGTAFLQIFTYLPFLVIFPPQSTRTEQVNVAVTVQTNSRQEDGLNLSRDSSHPTWHFTRFTPVSSGKR